MITQKEIFVELKRPIFLLYENDFFLKFFDPILFWFYGFYSSKTNTRIVKIYEEKRVF